jgi:hypothetical protein
MENRPIFLAYLWVWGAYVVALYAYALVRRKSLIVTTISHIVPTAVALEMAYIFLIHRGGTVRQLSAGSETGMDMWSLWVDSWFWILRATKAWGLAHYAWLLVVSIKAKARAWGPVAAAGLAMAAFAFYTAALNFPDA